MRFPDHTFTDIINNFGKNNSLITQHFNQSISGEEIAAISLFRAKRIARSEAETSMSGYVLVIPSYFTQAQRIALLHSSNIAGLNVLAFIESSTASAYFYGIERSRTMPINISTPYKLFTKQEIAYERQLEKERMKIDEEFLRSLNNPQDEDIQTQGSLIRRLITWIYKIIIYPFNIIKNIFNKNDKDDNNENGMSDEDRWRIFTGESNKNKNKNKEDQEKKQRNRELLNMKSKSGLSRNIDWESRDRKNVIGEDIRHIIFVDVGANQITFTLAEYHFDMENKIQSSSKDNAQSNKKDKQQKDSEYDGIVRGRGLLDIVVTLTKQGIGGNRFDEILQKTALQQILNVKSTKQQSHNKNNQSLNDISLDVIKSSQLRIQIERIVRHAKEMLSVSPTIRETIEIPNSAFANIPGIIKSKDFDNIGDVSLLFSREDFEANSTHIVSEIEQTALEFIQIVNNHFYPEYYSLESINELSNTDNNNNKIINEQQKEEILDQQTKQDHKSDLNEKKENKQEEKIAELKLSKKELKKMQEIKLKEEQIQKENQKKANKINEKENKMKLNQNNPIQSNSQIKPHFNFSSVPIELLGGTTRIPAVQQALIRVFTDIDQDKKNQSLQQQQQDQQKDEQKENEDEYNKSKEGSASIGRLLNMDESAALGATIFAQRTYAYAPLRKDNIIEQNKQKKQKKQFDKNEIIIELSTGEVEGGGQLNIRRRSLYSIQSTIDILWNKYQQQQDIHNNVLEEKEIIQLIKKGSKLSDSTKLIINLGDLILQPNKSQGINGIEQETNNTNLKQIKSNESKEIEHLFPNSISLSIDYSDHTPDYSYNNLFNISFPNINETLRQHIKEINDANEAMLQYMKQYELKRQQQEKEKEKRKQKEKQEIDQKESKEEESKEKDSKEEELKEERNSDNEQKIVNESTSNNKNNETKINGTQTNYSTSIISEQTQSNISYLHNNTNNMTIPSVLYNVSIECIFQYDRYGILHLAHSSMIFTQQDEDINESEDKKNKKENKKENNQKEINNIRTNKTKENQFNSYSNKQHDQQMWNMNTDISSVTFTSQYKNLQSLTQQSQIHSYRQHPVRINYQIQQPTSSLNISQQQQQQQQVNSKSILLQSPYSFTIQEYKIARDHIQASEEAEEEEAEMGRIRSKMESLAFMVMERIRQAREYQQKPNIKKLINGSDNKKIENTDEKSPIEYLLRVSTEKDREMIYKKANEAIEWIEENDGTPQMTLSAVNNLFDDLHKTIDPVFVRAEQCRIFDAVMKDARIRVANTTRVAESIREKMNIRLNKHKSEQMEHEAHLLEQKKQREQQKINQEMDNNQQGLDIEGWGDDEQKDNGIENIDNGKKLNDDLNIISEEQHTTENELDLELISDVEDASNYLSRWLDAAQLKHDTASPLEDPPVTVNDVINVINEMADMVRQSMTRDMERRAEFAERERQTLEARLQMEREILQNQISPGKDIQKDAQELNTDKSKLKKQKNELNQENSGPEL